MSRMASSAEVKLWRFDDKTAYEVLRGNPEVVGDNTLKPLEVDQVPIWRIDTKYRELDAAYDALPVEGDARADFLERSPVYRKDRRRRDGYQKGVPQDQIENHVELYEFPARGFRRERWLEENKKYYNEVWLNDDIQIHSAVDFSKTPNVEFDNLYDKWTDQIIRYHGSFMQVGSIAYEVRLLTGEAQIRKRRQLRRLLCKC